MLATLVDTSALWQTVVAAFVAALGVTLAFSLGLLGVARFVDQSRDGRNVAAAGSAVLAGVAFAAVAGAIVLGIAVMTAK